MASNYEKMAASARTLFLRHDQAAMIERWDLEHDDGGLYLMFFNERMRVDRATAVVTSLEPAGVYHSPDGVDETMAIFDLLTLSPTRPHATGRWASISTLGGIIGAGHDRTLSYEPVAAKFSGKEDALRAACERLGGTPLGKADVGYAVPVFEDFAIWFQYWEADDEFPANIKYLFDENALKYMHYETLWYVMNALADRLDYYVNGGDAHEDPKA